MKLDVLPGQLMIDVIRGTGKILPAGKMYRQRLIKSGSEKCESSCSKNRTLALLDEVRMVR